jgi:hypothetical protein
MNSLLGRNHRFLAGNPARAAPRHRPFPPRSLALGQATPAPPRCLLLALGRATASVAPRHWRGVQSGALLARAALLAAPLRELAKPLRCSRASLLDCTAAGALLARVALLAAPSWELAEPLRWLVPSRGPGLTRLHTARVWPHRCACHLPSLLRLLHAFFRIVWLGEKDRGEKVSLGARNKK